MRALLKFLGITLLAWTLGADLALAQQKTTLKVSSWTPRNHLMHRDIIAPWAEAVEQATNGRVKVEILPKAVMQPQGHFDAVRDGLADVAVIIPGYTVGRVPSSLMAELPLLTENSETTSVAYQRIFDRYFANLGEYRGLKVLSVFVHGPGQIYNAKQPVNSLADLKALKMRIGGGMIGEIARAISANTILKPSTESYELLSGGVIDGVFFPAESIPAFHLDKLIKYATLVPGGLYNASQALVMNQAKFESLDPQDRAAILKVSGEVTSRRAGQAWDAEDARANKVMAERNIAVIHAPPELVADLQDKTDPIVRDWVEKMNAKGIDGEKVIAEFKAELKKSSKK